jgi:cyclophilin family peptidyl-prolyl cis-trans isomerase/HEAT repeat protein
VNRILLLIFAFSFLQPFATAKPRRGISSLGAGGEGGVLRRIQEIENQRSPQERVLLSGLNSGSKRTVRAAILAAGRIGDSSTLDELSRILNKKDRELKQLAAFSLGLIGGDIAVKLLTQQIQMIKDSDAMGVMIVASGRAGNESTLPFFSSVLQKPDASPEILEAGGHGLGILLSNSTDKWVVPTDLLNTLVLLSQSSDSEVALAAAFALSRYKGPLTEVPVTSLTDALLKTPSADARALLCRTLGRVKSPVASSILVRQLMNDPAIGVRADCAGGLGNQDMNEILLAAERQKLTDASSPVVISLLESIAEQGPAAEALADNLVSLVNTSPSAWIKGTALKALARVNPERARPKANEVLTRFSAAQNPVLFTSAIGALGMLGSDSDIERVGNFILAVDSRVAVAAIDALSSAPEEKFSKTIKTDLKKALASGDTGIVTLTSEIIRRFKWKEFSGPLVAGYRKLRSSDALEAKVAVLNALGVLGDPSSIPQLETALNDPEKMVVEAAVAALRNSANRDESGRIPLNSKSVKPIPSSSEIRAAQGLKVVLKTTRGDIQLRMMSDDAPLTVTNFIHLVRQGFYKGKTFHRVVPNFVIQGGDPRGDGYGGPGYFIRDEVSLLKHERGMVGMATAGKDTGGSQFFIDTAPNLHLDGKYTIFAKVTKGIEVIDRIEVGDQIIQARVE